MARASGVKGTLTVGGQLAGIIDNWTLTDLDEGCEVTFSLARRDDYWITQRPMRITLELGFLSWSWDDVSFDGRATIFVSGPPREGPIATKEES